MNFEQLMKVFRGSSAGIPGSFYEEYVGCSPKAWFIGTVICRDKTVQHVVVYREKDVCKQDRFWYRCADAFCASVAQQATRPREGALRFATDGRVSTKDLALAYRAFLANASLGPSWFGKACSGMWRLVTWSEDTVAEYKKAKDLTAAEVMPLFCEPRSWDGSPKETAKCAFLRSCRSPEALLACLRQIANKDLVWDYINIATRNRCFGQPVWERLLAPYADNADVLYVAAINGCPANLMPQYVPVVQAAATATGRYQAWDRLSVLPSALTLESVTKLFATHDTYAMFNTGGCNAPDRFAPLFPLLRANRLSDALGLVHVLNNEQKSACLGSCKRWFASDVFTAVLGHLSHEHRSGNALSRNDASLLVPAIVGMARNATHEYAARAALDALLLLVDTGHRELVASDPTLTGSLQALAQIYPQEPVAQELLRVITHKDK